MIQHLKHYPLSILVVCAIVYLSLATMPETEMDDIPFIDKWAHFCMYGGLCGVIWIEYVRCHEKIVFTKTILPAIVFPLALSGLMELMQAYCTTTRNGDWLDMAANSIGVTLGTIVGYYVLRPLLKRTKK